MTAIEQHRASIGETNQHLIQILGHSHDDDGDETEDEDWIADIGIESQEEEYFDLI